jgi:hypothetical protein
VTEIGVTIASETLLVGRIVLIIEQALRKVGRHVNGHDLIMIGTGAVLSLVLTGSLKWLFALFDAVIPVSKAPEKVRIALGNKANRALFWSILFFLWIVGGIIMFAVDKSPITRLSILNGAMYLCGLVLSLTSLMWDIHTLSRERSMAKVAENAESPRAN